MKLLRLNLLLCCLGLAQPILGQINTASWMEDLYFDKPQQKLKNTVIPGSHDSATDKMNSSSSLSSTMDGALKLVPRSALLAWSKTQERDMYQQLIDGIRYFDLRVENTSRGWMTYHGLLSNELRPMLEQLGEFLERYPREIVILDFQSMVNFQDEQTSNLIGYLLNHPVLGSRIADWRQFNVESSFGDYWDHGKNVVVMMDRRIIKNASGNYVSTDLIWPRLIDNPWPNTRHTEQVKSNLMDWITKRNQSRFYVSQAIVTPDAHVITLGWFQGITSLKDMAVKWMNPELDALIPRLNQQALNHGKRLNIIIADFYNRSRLVELSLTTNWQNKYLD